MEFVKKHKIAIIFIAFFLLVLLQNQFIYLFFDDYAYGSLSYANIIDVPGTNYNILDIISFCIGHYNAWCGRILCFFIEIVLIKLGLPTYRLVQSIVITLIFFLIYLIIKKYSKKSDVKLALLSISLYGLIDIAVINNGYFWISASVSYVFPLLPFLLFIYLYDKKDKTKLDYIICTISIILASFSQEQISSSVVFYMAFKTIYNYIKSKKISKLDITYFLISLIFFLIVVLAPGNQNRVEVANDFYSLSLFGKLTQSIPTILNAIFRSSNKYFIDLLSLTTLFVSIRNIKNKYNLINKISLLISILFLISQILLPLGVWSTLKFSISNQLIIGLIFIIPLFNIIYTNIYYLIINKKYNLLNIILSALVSQAVMLMSPYYPMRSVIMFQIYFFIYIGYILNEEKYLKLYLICILIVSIFNYAYILEGYYQNNKSNKYNHQTLLEQSKLIKQDNSINIIKLKKLQNPLFASELPYENVEIIYPKLKQYYDIPENIEIIYE